jgi:hypothetical protein
MRERIDLQPRWQTKPGKSHYWRERIDIQQKRQAKPVEATICLLVAQRVFALLSKYSGKRTQGVEREI